MATLQERLNRAKADGAAAKNAVSGGARAQAVTPPASAVVKKPTLRERLNRMKADGKAAKTAATPAVKPEVKMTPARPAAGINPAAVLLSRPSPAEGRALLGMNPEPQPTAAKKQAATEMPKIAKAAAQPKRDRYNIHADREPLVRAREQARKELKALSTDFEAKGGAWKQSEEAVKKYSLDRAALMGREGELNRQLDALDEELKKLVEAEEQALIDSGEYRKASLKDLTLGSVKQGYYNSRYGQESYKDMMGQDSEKEELEDLLSGEDYKFIPRGWLEKAVSGGAGLLGQQVRQWTDPRSVATGAAAAGMALAAGNAGPQALVPEEALTVPGAFAIGMQAGSAVSNLEIEAGFAYNEMIKNGISADTARTIALAVGTGNAALEFVQMDELLKSFRVLKQSGATQTIAQRLGKELWERGLDVGAETLQEDAQETVTIAGTQLANKLEKGEWAYTGEEVLDRLGETALSSALSFGTMNVPAAGLHAAQIFRGQPSPAEQFSGVDTGEELLAKAAREAVEMAAAAQDTQAVQAQKTAPGVEAASTAINTDPAGHTPEEMETITAYQNAVDEGIKNFVARVRTLRNKGYRNKVRYSISKVSEAAASVVKALTGVDPTGFENILTGGAVDHIDHRHGENGQADSSMADVNDLARVQFVLDHFDGATLLVDGKGQPLLSNVWKNSDNTQARQIMFYKKIDGTYYVVEAVPDSNARVLAVESAYIGTKEQIERGTGTVLNMAQGSAPQVTPETPQRANTSLTNSIPQPPPGVNPETPKGGPTDTAVPQPGDGVEPESVQDEALDIAIRDLLDSSAVSGRMAGTIPVDPETAAILEQAAETAAAAQDTQAGQADAKPPVDTGTTAGYNGATQQTMEEERDYESGSAEIHLRDGGQRSDGADPGGQVRRLEGGTGQDQGRTVQAGPKDAGAAALTYGRQVTTGSLGIGGGSNTNGVRLVTGGDTEATRAAKAIAKEQGLRLVLFAGNNLTIRKGRKTAGVRAYISGDRAFVRVDHPEYTAEQLMRHEAGHDRIAKGEIDPQTVRERINKELGAGKLEQLAGLYEEAYRGTGLTADEVWEEVICDSLGDMNIFSGTIREEAAKRLLKTTKAAAGAEREANQTRGPPQTQNAAQTDGEGKASLNLGFPSKVEKWIKETKPEDRLVSPGYFRIGATSDVLKDLGVKDCPVFWRKQKIGYIMAEHPEMDIATIKAVPSLVENPVVILKSLTREDSIVLLGDLKATNGKLVMVALELTPKKGGGMEADFALVSSAYSRTDDNIQNLVWKSDVLYLDPNKKRTDTWLMQLGVQFPSRQPVYGSIGSISYNGQNVNIQGVPFSDVVKGEELKGDFSRELESIEGLRKENRELKGKYWRPKLNRAEWALLNHKMETAGEYLDEVTCWVYASEKGTTVFAVYGIGDGTENTPLYASSGKQAVANGARLKRYLEGKKNGTKSGRAALDRLLKHLENQRGDAGGHLYDRAGARTGDVPISLGQPGSDGRGSAGQGAGDRGGVKPKASQEPESIEKLWGLARSTGDRLALRTDDGEISTPAGELPELQQLAHEMYPAGEAEGESAGRGLESGETGDLRTSAGGVSVEERLAAKQAKLKEIQKKYGLTDDEAWAVNEYKSSESYKVNAKLRDGVELNPVQERMVALLDSALEKLPRVEGTVYRTLSFDDMFDGQEEYDAFLAQHQEGGIATYNAYTSTSTKADGHPLADGTKLGVTLEITGSGARNLDGFGNNFESEALFPRDTDFIITKITVDENGHPHICMKEAQSNG